MVRSEHDEALVAQAQHDDLAAEQELVARYSLLVATIISREGLISRTGTRDDLIQHGYIGLLAAIRTYRSDMGASFKTYASTCIRNEMISALRSESSKKHGALTTADSIDDDAHPPCVHDLHDSLQLTPEERLLALDYSKQLSRSIEDKLSVREREVLSRYTRGYTYSEIALQMGITTKAVDGAIQRARKKITTSIDAHE